MNLETYKYFYRVAQCVFVLTINYISIDYLYRPSYKMGRVYWDREI